MEFQNSELQDRIDQALEQIRKDFEEVEMSFPDFFKLDISDEIEEHKKKLYYRITLIEGRLSFNGTGLPEDILMKVRLVLNQ